VTHVVFFRFATPDQAVVAAEKLRGLLGVVPTLQSLEVGVDELGSDRSWDLCLITRFANRAGMDSYQQHPAHLEVVSWLREHATAIAAVDWS